MYNITYTFTAVVVPLGIVLALSLLYYPLFACVETRIPLLGHTIGFFYAVTW